jgi:uncharacterized membrane protein YkvA (DUF1232 family)
MEMHGTIRAKAGAWAERARRLRVELYALYLAARHPQTPWYARLVVAGFVAYAVTPVDLVPDAIPILGIVDDLIFVPLAIAAAIRFVPAPVLAECRDRARERTAVPSSGWRVMAVVWTLLGIAFITTALLRS